MIARAILAVVVAAPAPAIAVQVGQARLLIVFAPAASSPPLAAQRQAAAAAHDDFAERDLHLVEVVGDRVTGAADRAAVLRRHYGVASSVFRVVLVGKDGGVKLDAAAPISTARLIATIDAMPMRRDEMRRR